MRRIGMLTSGGDCQALNATMRGVGKVLYNKLEDVEVLGFKDGYRGLMLNDYRVMRPSDFSGILTMGGTILGSSRQPFKKMRIIEEDGFDKVAAMKKTYRDLGLECLVILGGNGSQKTANLLMEEGLNIVSLPKTIDNDIYGTDMTFGFQSAVDIATNAIDCIHTTAASHGRVFIVEVMGHKVGWLTLHSGIAGGADIILLPEIPYDLDCVLAAIERRHRAGKRFSILAVAEGAISKSDALLTKKEYNKKKMESPYPSVSYELGAQIQEAIGREVRITVPGHTQRGGSPDAYDRFISSRLGAAAGRLVVERRYGQMVAFDGFEVTSVPLGETAGRLKYVDPDGTAIREAKDMGICFGDE
ncbi:MAG: 6-phosphofructokinase [Clostridia bacterium]|nr:ATP-dependent 6-phosphofructokinase [Lachnospiraceae bacterium]NCB99325.1 6-phosphofructokinase [Clostridia bacterium]NCD01572.1 6-phosphofructokinase [Clostridia bacterium]